MNQRADLPFKQMQACILTGQSFRIRNPVATGIALAFVQQGLSVQVCTASFCQDRKILFAAVFNTLRPRGGLFVWPGITCHLYHLVSKNHRSLNFWLYSPKGIHTVTSHIKQHTCGSGNAAGVFFFFNEITFFTVYSQTSFSAFIRSSCLFTFCFSVSPISLFSLTLSVTLTHYLTYTTSTHTHTHMDTHKYSVNDHARLIIQPS